MIYLKSALVGLLTACVAVLITVAALVRVEYSDGSGAAYASVNSWQILIAATVGFGVGCWWTLRRARPRLT
jgi:hypothetical protein